VLVLSNVSIVGVERLLGECGRNRQEQKKRQQKQKSK
jgi:hypothetical protein